MSAHVTFGTSTTVSRRELGRRGDLMMRIQVQPMGFYPELVKSIIPSGTASENCIQHCHLVCFTGKTDNNLMSGG